MLLIGQIFFYLRGLGANPSVSGKLDMKLAILATYSTLRGSRKFCQKGSSSDVFFIKLKRGERIQIQL